MTDNLGPAISLDTARDWIDRTGGTLGPAPLYLYDGAVAHARAALLARLFGPAFKTSYAIKSNPNQALVTHMGRAVDYLDASSYAEVTRALAACDTPGRISWSGPGKRLEELQAFIGLGAELVIESDQEIEDAGAIATAKGVTQDVLLRINPDHVPRGFGASMSGKPSQFGIDEGAVAEAIARIDAQPNLTLVGFHIYTGSNSLSPAALIENFENMARLFLQFSDGGTRPLRKLIFGAGFGLPYHPGQEPLNLQEVSPRAVEIVQDLRTYPGLAQADCVLELGRWLVGPAGMLLTTVLTTKHSRGQAIAICDAGFNNHLAACGLMGSVFRKDWPIRNVSAGPKRALAEVKLTGPLCTSIDALAGPMELPQVERGDVIAVLLSGAYGLTSSPTRFISHPEPLEVLFDGTAFRDVTESLLNHVLPEGAAS